LTHEYTYKLLNFKIFTPETKLFYQFMLGKDLIPFPVYENTGRNCHCMYNQSVGIGFAMV